jgi:hypothetical protein
MPNRLQSTVLQLGSVGFATDMLPTDRKLTHYQRLENVIFEVDKTLRKVGGNTPINSLAIASTPEILGMYDYWFEASGSFTQKFVAVTDNGKVYKEDMDGTFDDITGGATIANDAIPVFCQAHETLLIFFHNIATPPVPLKWTGSGDVATYTNAPNGRGAVFHNGRVWIWGTLAFPSRIYYSASNNIEDFSGLDAGALDLDIGDGDRIIGAASYKDALIVFKGPNKGKIYVIHGTAPTGGDAYRKNILVRDIALQSHNSIVPVGDDLWFMSDQAIHSLQATEAYGNFKGAFLTRHLRKFFREDVNRTRLNQVWGVNYALKDSVLWVMPGAGQTANTLTFGLSYADLQDKGGLKPFTWTRSGQSAALRVHPTTKAREVVFGSTGGYALREDTLGVGRSLATTAAYNLRALTNHIVVGEIDSVGKAAPYIPANLYRMALRSDSVGSYNVNINLRRSEAGGTSYAFSQGAAGFILGTSVLGTDMLGGGKTRTVTKDVMGETRIMQLDITQGGFNEDAKLHEVAIDWKPVSQASSTDLAAT